MKGAMLSQETLKELLHYDPDTGVFTQLKARQGACVGSTAGSLDGHGYVQIRLNYKLYRAHRLAWLYVHGTFPPNMLDHVNRDRADNRICNLRLATNAENMQNQSVRSNNTTGHIGVFWRKDRQKWIAQIKINYKQLYLGIFSDLSEAIAARKAAEINYYTFQTN